MRAEQFYDNATDHKQLLYVNRPDRTGGIFAPQEITISKQLVAYVGFRYDQSLDYSGFFSPQTAVVWTPTERTIVKGVYGRPFRNASTFEQFPRSCEILKRLTGCCVPRSIITCP